MDDIERPGHLYDRHPDTVHLLRMLWPNENLPAALYSVSVRFHDLATALVSELGDGPELTVGLRKLLEAKDCCVRAALCDLAESGVPAADGYHPIR